MQLTKFAQSTILLEAQGYRVLVDPGSYNYEPGRMTRSGWPNVDILIFTHKHADHFDLDAASIIYHACAPQILTVPELYERLAEKGIPAQVFKVGETITRASLKITAMMIDHVVDGERIDGFGLTFEDGRSKVYWAGDTFVLPDAPSADVVLIPINNRGVSMSLDEAVDFVRTIQPQLAIPMHYDSPKDKHIDPREFVTKVTAANINSTIIEFGTSIEI
ncbi:MAG: MBL fold metallo-hydrolase [Acidobacteria bacterium]|nr:MBL fold metallo-hydrolase [Acidobacteriota bacterium]